jgi:uncharacterized protein
VIAREPGWEAIAHLWDSAAGGYASLLTYVETRAALAARQRTSRGGRRQFQRIRVEFDERWQLLEIVEFNELLAQIAALAAEQHALRGADAIHLASAARLGSGVAMVTLDVSLRRASLAAGLDVAP